MFTVSYQHNRWRVHKDRDIVLSGLGTETTALQIAKLYGILLTEFNNQITLKSV